MYVNFVAKLLFYTNPITIVVSQASNWPKLLDICGVDYFMVMNCNNSSCFEKHHFYSLHTFREICNTTAGFKSLHKITVVISLTVKVGTLLSSSVHSQPLHECKHFSCARHILLENCIWNQFMVTSVVRITQMETKNFVNRVCNEPRLERFRTIVQKHY